MNQSNDQLTDAGFSTINGNLASKLRYIVSIKYTLNLEDLDPNTLPITETTIAVAVANIYVDIYGIYYVPGLL